MEPLAELFAALAAAVDERFETEQVAFLAALVNAPSCSREPEDVERAAELLDARAAALGWTATRHADPLGRFADHRVFAAPALGSDEPALALVGHIDTVFPRALGFLGFSRSGDEARGPGVLDMKSGLSSIFGALEAVARVAPERALKVRVVINSDEEVGSASSRDLLQEIAAKTTRALVFEAGRAEDRIVTSRKGVGSFALEARGRGAHAGLAHADGVNAIEALAHAIVRLEALTDPARGATVNVGLIEGGTSANTVPDRASCTIDCRYVDPADGAWLEARVTDAARHLPPHLAGASLHLSGSLHRPPMVPTDATRTLLADYGAHARAAGLGSGEAPLQGGGSDANLLAAAGVPCIDGLGPSGTGIHQTSERCSLDSLRRRTIALARFLTATAS